MTDGWGLRDASVRFGNTVALDRLSFEATRSSVTVLIGGDGAGKSTALRALVGLPVNGHVETFVDTGQVFLKNAANATDLPDVDLSGLTAEQKKTALRRMNAEGCTCGCKLTIAECRINDTTCPVSKNLAEQIVKEVAAGGTAEQQSTANATKPAGN